MCGVKTKNIVNWKEFCQFTEITIYQIKRQRGHKGEENKCRKNTIELVSIRCFGLKVVHNQGK